MELSDKINSRLQALSSPIRTVLVIMPPFGIGKDVAATIGGRKKHPYANAIYYLYIAPQSPGAPPGSRIVVAPFLRALKSGYSRPTATTGGGGGLVFPFTGAPKTK